MTVTALGILAVGTLCLLVPAAVVALVLYLTRREKAKQPAPDAGLDPFGQPWGGEHADPATSRPEDRQTELPREYGATGGFRRVADQSASVGAPSTDDAPDAPRYGYIDADPVAGETVADAPDRPETELEPEPPSPEPSTEAPDDPFVLHAPSDDVEQTIRISRSSGEAEPTAPSWAATIPGEDVPAEEHTYWDDEEEEQARRAESLVDEGEAIVDGGYGWGSAAPFADGSMPPGHPVKGHRAWMQYHEPGSPWYDETTVDVWFTDAAAAERAGFHRA